MTTWTAARVQALGVRTDLATACEIVLGVRKSRAFELHKAGQLPFPTLRCGRRIVVPVAPLLELLGIKPETNGAGPATGPATATHAHQDATWSQDATPHRYQ